MSTEFQFINNMKRLYGLAAVGDDCAVLPKDEASDMLVSADMLVEDVDFRARWSTPELIGHKALAVSLSDIAAMGGTPMWSILSLAIPKVHWQENFGERFFTGYMKLASRFGVELSGGDLSSSPNGIVVDSTVIGVTRKNAAVRRGGLRPGQLICVTGSLGAAAAALRELEAGTLASDAGEDLVARLLAPTPRVETGRLLGELGICGAMIDVSDGLAADLGHLCDLSGCGAMINAGAVPRFPSPKVSLEDALYGGEDFELLFSIDPNDFEKYREELRHDSISVIGEVTSNAGVITLNEGEQCREIDRRGYRHF